MGYFRAKSDYKFIQDFFKNVLKLWEIENSASKQISSHFMLPSEHQKAIVAKATSFDQYQEIRMKVARGVTKASYLADINRVPIHMMSYPPPAVGGAIIPINMFEAILDDNSYSGVDDQMIFDALNRTVGASEERIKKEFFNMINPLYWLKQLIVFILRIPFLILSATGFNISKIEDNLLAKLFKVCEVVAILYILLKFGNKLDSVKDLVSVILQK